mmetsp:Transcript_11816/g.32225  ORF Transcript_11816/g.32225 Transcript_11816/m.32225 type:complete len:298 (+) Transcript_11816:1553-2446(+)
MEEPAAAAALCSSFFCASMPLILHASLRLPHTTRPPSPQPPPAVDAMASCASSSPASGMTLAAAPAVCLLLLWLAVASDPAHSLESLSSHAAKPSGPVFSSSAFTASLWLLPASLEPSAAPAAGTSEPPACMECLSCQSGKLSCTCHCCCCCCNAPSPLLWRYSCCCCSNCPSSCCCCCCCSGGCCSVSMGVAAASSPVLASGAGAAAVGCAASAASAALAAAAVAAASAFSWCSPQQVVAKPPPLKTAFSWQSYPPDVVAAAADHFPISCAQVCHHPGSRPQGLLLPYLRLHPGLV